MKIIIDGTLPSLNDYIAALNKNRYKGAKMKNQVEHLIVICAKRSKAKKCNKPVNVLFHWVEKNRRRDKDNVAFAKKFIFDGLIKAGVLQGDGWRHVVGFADSFDVDSKNPRVEVVIKELKQ